MYTRHSQKTLSEIKRLRRDGMSIDAISLKLSIAKTTIWHVVKNIELTSSQKKILHSNKGGSRNRKLKSLDEAQIRAAELLAGTYREKIIIIAMLYWAEGHKRGRCEFTNTDPHMIAVYLMIVRKVLEISEDRIEATIRIFTGMSESESVAYWLKVTHIPKERIKVRINDGGVRGGTPYGMCRVTIRKSQAVLKLFHALIQLVTQDIMLPL